MIPARFNNSQPKHPGDHIHKEMCHEQRDHIGVDQLCYAAGHKSAMR